MIPKSCTEDKPVEMNKYISHAWFCGLFLYFEPSCTIQDRVKHDFRIPFANISLKLFYYKTRLFKFIACKGGKKITTNTNVHKCTHRTATSSISHNREKKGSYHSINSSYYVKLLSRIKHGNMFLTEFFILKQAHSSRAGRGDGSPFIKIMQNMYYNKICCKHKKNF